MNRTSACPLRRPLHLGFAKLYRRIGERQEAQQHLTIATTMYRKMDLLFSLSQAETSMTDLA